MAQRRRCVDALIKKMRLIYYRVLYGDAAILSGQPGALIAVVPKV